MFGFTRHSLAAGRRAAPRLAIAALSLAAAAVAFAGENSWTHVPFAEKPDYPVALIATSESGVWYWQTLNGLLRSADDGRTFSKVEVPIDHYVFAVDPFDPDVLFLQTDGFLQRSADAGRTWLAALAPDALGGTLEIRPSPRSRGRIYVASATTLWLSSDGGASFASRGALPGDRTEVPMVSLQEANDGQLYLLRSDTCGYHHCGDALRVYRSADQGASWQEIFAGHSNPQSNQLLVHPNRPQTIYLRRTEDFHAEARLLRSDDRGATFSDLGPAPGGRLSTDASRPEALFSFAEFGISRSLDGGVSWQSLADPRDSSGRWDRRYTGAAIAAGRLRIFASPEEGQAPLFFDSTDFGGSFAAQPIGGLFPDSASWRLGAGSAPGVFHFSDSTRPRVATSRDGGAGWQLAALPPDVRFLAADPRRDNVLYGYETIEFFTVRIVVSRDGGATFQPLSPGWVTHVEDFAAYPYGETTALAVVLGNGDLAHSADGGATWATEPWTPDGFLGKTWRRVVADGETLYAINNHTEVFRSTNGGDSWELRSAGHFGLKAGGGLLADLDPYQGKLQTSEDGGLTWRDVPLPFAPWDFYEDGGLQVDRHGAIYLIGNRRMLLRSRDRGRTWQALTQDLPEYWGRPVVAVGPGDPDLVVLGTPVGLYRGRFADSPALALGGGRFEARLYWRAGGGGGEGFPASLADDGGFFRLFSGERSEVAVRLRDSRPANGHWGISIAAQTDVELDLEVLDRASGETWTWHQAPGEQQSFTDGEAFPREGAQITAGLVPEPPMDFPASDTAVVLADRFEVSVERPGAGEVPPAQGRLLLGETAAFSGLDGKDSDVWVNLIDGRPVNGRFWIFAASLEGEEFVLRVRDRETGASRSYRHPGGFLAALSDSGAF